MKELQIIQSQLHSEKDKQNKFGNYNYRSAEGILKNLKPLLKENECYVTLTDELQQVGDRIYVVATATLYNNKGEVISAKSMAREDESLKGMSGGQITGAASSYARKYALCGLFAIDDSGAEDLDDVAGKPEPAKKETKAAPVPKATPAPETIKETKAAPVPKATPAPETIAEYKEKFDSCKTMDEASVLWDECRRLGIGDALKDIKNITKKRINEGL